MDENKRKKLKAVNYRITGRCCKFCLHSVFTTGDFGDCQKHEYQHLKHGPKKLSIHKTGCCDDFAPDETLLSEVDKWPMIIKDSWPHCHNLKMERVESNEFRPGQFLEAYSCKKCSKPKHFIRVVPLISGGAYGESKSILLTQI